MLNLLIRSLSPIIYAKQTTTSLAHLVSSHVLYFPLRINKANPSNCNNTEFLASAGTNSCNHKTLSRHHQKHYFCPFLAYYTGLDDFHTEVWQLWQTILVINYPHQTVFGQKWRKVPWLPPGTAELKLTRSGPAVTPESKINYLCHVIPTGSTTRRCP